MKKSIFLKVEGDKPMTRIWDFLIVHSEYDYSLKDISDMAGVSYAMTKILFKNCFIPRRLIKQRNVGQAKLFHLDFDNPVVERFKEYYWAVVEANTKIEENRIKQRN